MSYRTLIIEDESLARQRLKMLLKPYENVINLIGEAENGQIGLELIQKHNTELIFLDIQMPGLTGFEMLERLEEIPLVIFTTAYDEFALQAFETNAIDYLLKPVSQERLNKALNKLQSLTANKKMIDQKLHELIKEIQHKEKSYIKVKTGSITKLIDFKDIVFFRAEDKYTCLKTPEKAYFISESLNNLERKLPDNFKRIHRSTLININHLKEILTLSLSKSIAVMTDNSELPISRRMKKEL